MKTKTEAKHTPGPWTIMETPELSGRRKLHIIGGKDGDDPIATLRMAFVDDDANADLIAAAPELLEACILVKEITKKSPDNPYERLGRIEAIMDLSIAKAEGGK